MSDLPFQTTDFARSLLAWYARAGRSLPWRQTRDPYRIWLSEIMLQQTTVAAVLGYYERFLERFPTLERLAAAAPEEVIDLWAGLGYYSRARNLHATAVRIVNQPDGRFPSDPDRLQQLPGIGRSTAGAIAALAFGRPAPILDANVRRVLCRIFALRRPPRSSVAEQQLWRWAEQLVPDNQAHDYTQGMMDLGAMICLPKKPLCGDCPLSHLCQAFKMDLQDEIPVRGAKKAVPLKYEAVALLHRGGRYQLQRRPVDGFLGGLWEFPSLSLAAADAGETTLRQYLAQNGLRGEVLNLGSIRHAYSHFQLEVHIFQVRITASEQIAEAFKEWRTIDEIADLALHGAHKKVYKKLLNTGV